MRKDERTVRAAAVWAAALFLLFLTTGAAFCATKGPEDVIKGFSSTLLEAMKRAGELGYEGRYKLLEPVVKDSFALPFMARQSAGRYWETFTDEQKTRFVKTYTDWTVATYAGRFDGWSGEKFDTGPAKAAPVGGAGTEAVVSTLVSPDNNQTAFHYLLRDIDGGWRIIDIQISGVSQLALTRAQFSAVLKDKGLDGLLAMMRDKIEKFAGTGKK